jgi:hypothetical protein
MKSRSPATDRYNIPTPPYTLGFVPVAVSVVGCAVTLLAFLATDLAWLWRAVAAAGVAAACVVAPNAWFASRWLWSQWRRARLYPALFERRRVLENQLAAWQGTLALAAQPVPLSVERLYEAGGRVRIVIGDPSRAALQRGENLLVVYALESRLVGRARVVANNTRSCEAEVHEPMDALFWGYVRQQVASYRRRMPEDVAVFREADVMETKQAFARLMQEVEE